MKIFIYLVIFAINSVFSDFLPKNVCYIDDFQCENEISKVKKFKYLPIVLKMWNKNDNLRTMKRVLDRLGYERVNDFEDDW